MFNPLVRVQRWWRPPARPSTAYRIPFEVVCVCGQHHTGWRQHTHQVLTCPGCNRRVFVLPISPLPRRSPPPTAPAVPVTPQKKSANPWIGPLVGAGLTLVCVVSIFVFLFGSAFSWRSTAPVVASASLQEMESQITNGKKAVVAGDFGRAVECFDTARDIAKRNPALLPAGRVRELIQLRRQAALMVDWPGERLEVALGRAAGLSDHDWQTLADLRRGRCVLFDGTLRRDPTGQVHVTRTEPVEGQTFRVPLQHMTLLKTLSLADPQRVIFLARLARARREGPGVCVLELEAKSGVLLTDPSIARRCGYSLPDPEVESVLRRQQEWVKEMPGE